MRKRVTLFVTSFLALGAALFTFGASGESPKPALGPDLVVREDVLSSQWVLRVEDLPANFCSVIEGEVTPGVHKLLRFTVTTSNVGDSDIYIGDPQVHVDANDGLFEFATCHQHYHFRHYATYELVSVATGQTWRAAKRGFCMLDTDPVPSWLYPYQKGPGKFKNCGAFGIAGNQGITAGWSDTYNWHLGGQYFVLDGGDNQPVVPAGDYYIRITVNPPFTAKRGEPCPNKDPNGFCHQLPESNYFNNVGQVVIRVTDRPGKTGIGPLAGSENPLKEEKPEH